MLGVYGRVNGKERNSGELVGLWQLNMKHEQRGDKRVKGNFKISSLGNEQESCS